MPRYGKSVLAGADRSPGNAHRIPGSFRVLILFGLGFPADNVICIDCRKASPLHVLNGL